MKISNDLSGKIVQFLRVLANEENWSLDEIRDRHGDFLFNNLTWEKDSWDPRFVAQDLLEQLPLEDE